MSNILITGASGLIGKRLTELLVQQGHQVSHLGRTKHNNGIKSFVWNISLKTIDADAFNDVDVIIHLAGAGIADKPWSERRKQEILESRTESTRLLFNELKRREHSVHTFISASAIGYYGFQDNEKVFTEDDLPGEDFLANVVKLWEQEVDELQKLNLRVVKIRVGIVLSMQGGALKEMVKPVKYYAGAPLGSGNQNMSWIHIDDLCAVFIKAVNDYQMQGAYNATGPYAVTNREFTKALAHVLNKPLYLPSVPAFILNTIFGEMADLILKGSKVSSEKIQKTGFQFKYKTLEKALENLLK